MGCFSSKERRLRAYAVSGSGYAEFNEIDKGPETATQSPPIQDNETGQPPIGSIVNAPRPKLDPKDFQFVDCKDAIKIKNSGTINGQSFTIDKCENCDIYILDHCAQITVDDCKGCRLYLGPTDGSVFIRDCTGCNVAVVCRQLRTRDCTDCNIALYCRTKPIVESSSNMGFSCLDLSYPELRDHMRHARLSPFHNFWYDIFDFTPKDGNWRLLPHGTEAVSLLEPIPAEVSELITAGQEASPKSPLLLTTGGRLPQQQQEEQQQPATNDLSYMFVAFDGTKHEQALQLARENAEKGWLLRTNEARLSPVAATALATEAGWAKALGKTLSSGNASCVGLELSVPGVEAQAVKKQATQLGGHVSDREAAGKTFRTAGLDG